LTFYLHGKKLQRLRGKKYKSTCDIWSFGITVLEMSFGRHPFHGMGTVEIVMTIDEWDGRVSNLMGRMEEPGLEELVGLCLAKEEVRRPNAEVLKSTPILTRTLIAEEEAARGAAAGEPVAKGEGRGG
jgi:serine/threonine protein kinase